MSVAGSIALPPEAVGVDCCPVGPQAASMVATVAAAAMNESIRLTAAETLVRLLFEVDLPARCMSGSWKSVG